MTYHCLRELNCLREDTKKTILSFVVSNCDVVTFPLVSWVGVVIDCIDT